MKKTLEQTKSKRSGLIVENRSHPGKGAQKRERGMNGSIGGLKLSRNIDNMVKYCCYMAPRLGVLFLGIISRCAYLAGLRNLKVIFELIFKFCAAGENFFWDAQNFQGARAKIFGALGLRPWAPEDASRRSMGQ